MLFKINTNEISDIGSVCMRDRIAYDIRTVSADEAEFTADIDEERFAELRKDAECEREMRMYFPHFIPVYSMDTIRNPEKFLRLQKIYRADEPGDFPRGRMPVAPLQAERDEFETWLYPDRSWADPEEWGPPCENQIIGMHRIYLMETLCGPIDDRVAAHNIAGWGWI